MNDELASRINEILFTQWDPIGVNDTPEHTQNEYYRYTPQIIDALNSGASKDDIAQL